ncbi:MAG: ATPase, T2SS/T4P/T4SS family, partial [Patescibacteria group bacterium]
MSYLPDLTIEDILFEQKIISSDQLAAVKLEHINTGRPVEAILLEKEFVSQQQLIETKARLIGVPYVDIANQAISPEVLAYVPEQVAKRDMLIPFAYEVKTGTLSVAMADPLDLQVIEFIEKKSRAKIIPFLADREKIRLAIAERYSQSLSSDVTEALKEVPEEEKIKSQEEESLEKIDPQAGISKIVSRLLEFAVKARASDVHMEPLEDKTRVRYRIDGILHEKLILPRQFHESLVSRVKILSGMKIDEKRLPQDGRFNYKFENDDVDLRVSTLPTAFGEKVVMRLLKKSGGVPTLSELGLRGPALKNLEISMLKPHGIIIVCGPTGSGKTTTLYSVLTKINSTKVNIITIEDPIEYQIAGINQVQVNAQAGLTFASGLRSFLRQ